MIDSPMQSLTLPLLLMLEFLATSSFWLAPDFDVSYLEEVALNICRDLCIHALYLRRPWSSWWDSQSVYPTLSKSHPTSEAARLCLRPLNASAADIGWPVHVFFGSEQGIVNHPIFSYDAGGRSCTWVSIKHSPLSDLSVSTSQLLTCLRRSRVLI
ncbi:hypothetical protein K474DRAFT_642268 [Panus rudis PR-1116 ss-1]|nr:hypothetical protein K474DRAFT_642268 [Panus rudis PR-1116 ss-1]